MDTPVPLDVALAVLWHFGDQNRGVQPGRFHELLLKAMSAADVENRNHLVDAFPEWGAAFLAAATTSWGMDWLQKKAEAGA